MRATGSGGLPDPVEPVHVDIENPERAVDGREGSCDTFVCLYVLELTAGPEEALRIVRIAERLLVSGGLAFIQVKYRTAIAVRAVIDATTVETWPT